MSYDLMVFEKNQAPAGKADFLKWYRERTEWTEDHNYDDPAVSSPALQYFFNMVRCVFPPMNSRPAPEKEKSGQTVLQEERRCDYCIGKDVIYLSFSFSVAERARDVVKRAAYFSGTGFFEPGEVFGPCFFTEDRPTHLEGEWFRPAAVSCFQEVEEKLAKMTAKNRSFLFLEDPIGNYIQVGGFKNEFTVEVRRYTDPVNYTHRKAGYISAGVNSNASERNCVFIGGNRVSTEPLQVLSLDTVIGLFGDFYNGTKTMNMISWTDMDL